MFSPLPTLFFTLLTNLLDKTTRLIHSYLNSYSHYVTLIWAKTTGKTVRGISRKKQYLHSAPQTGLKAWLWQHRGKNTEQCENKTKQKKGGEKEGLRRDKDIDEEPEIINTESHILSSRQILGPMTLAAPDTRRKARCFGGQGAESPHLYFRGWGSVKKHVDHKKEDKNATLWKY